MSRTTHTCPRCGADLASKRDLPNVQGTVHATWLCRFCRTKVPGIVAEKLRQQRQN